MGSWPTQDTTSGSATVVNDANGPNATTTQDGDNDDYQTSNMLTLGKERPSLRQQKTFHGRKTSRELDEIRHQQRVDEDRVAKLAQSSIT